MSLCLETLQYDPDLGRSVLRTVGKIDFNPLWCATREEAAKKLHEALTAYAIRAGYGENSVLLWTPEEADQRGYGKCWMISWEAGPCAWAIHLSFQVTGPWGCAEPYHSSSLCFTG